MDILKFHLQEEVKRHWVCWDRWIIVAPKAKGIILIYLELHLHTYIEFHAYNIIAQIHYLHRNESCLRGSYRWSYTRLRDIIWAIFLSCPFPPIYSTVCTNYQVVYLPLSILGYLIMGRYKEEATEEDNKCPLSVVNSRHKRKPLPFRCALIVSLPCSRVKSINYV